MKNHPQAKRVRPAAQAETTPKHTASGHLASTIQRSPRMIAQRQTHAALLGPALVRPPARSGSAPVQRTEHAALAKANEFLSPKAKRFADVQARKYELSREQWSSVVRAWNAGVNSGMRLRDVYDAPPAPNLKPTASPAAASSLSQNANRALDAVGYAEMMQSAADTVTTTDNPLSNLLHTIAPPVVVASAARNASRQASAASSSFADGDLLGSARHGLSSLAFATKAATTSVTGGADPLTMAATGVAHVTQAPEYLASASTAWQQRHKHVNAATNTVLPYLPQNTQGPARAVVKKLFYGEQK